MDSQQPLERACVWYRIAKVWDMQGCHMPKFGVSGFLGGQGVWNHQWPVEIAFVWYCKVQVSEVNAESSFAWASVRAFKVGV